jgi:hypothetical protein
MPRSSDSSDEVVDIHFSDSDSISSEEKNQPYLRARCMPTFFLDAMDALHTFLAEAPSHGPPDASTPAAIATARTLSSIRYVHPGLAPLQRLEPHCVLSIFSGALHGILHGRLAHGHKISSLTLSDIDPVVRIAGASELQALYALYPAQSPLSSIVGCYDRLPHGITTITHGQLSFACPLDLVLASPLTHMFSVACLSKHGLCDPRSQPIYASASMICILNDMQAIGVNYVIDNVPCASRHAAITYALGQHVLARAHELGSSAR